MTTMPAWLKPPIRQPDTNVTEVSGLSSEMRPIALHEIMGWDEEWRRLLFRVLLPDDILQSFSIDPITLTTPEQVSVVRVIHGESDHSIRFELYHTGGARDAMMELELADTSFNQIEVTWLAIQDPYSPRFDVDQMPNGQSTMRGVMRRNIEAEEAALEAGLAPGQVRKGLGAFHLVAPRLETFMSCINQREYLAQPLFYHTAILFERAGFAYVQGHTQMDRIDRGFAPGGELLRKLDNSSPFRSPALADSVRGRAWAIHAGILAQPWDRVRMIKRLGIDAAVDTSPGLPW